MSGKRRGLSISWYEHHRRSDEIAEVVGIDAHYVRSEARLLPIRYASQARETRALLRKHRPSVVVVMQPPPFALFTVARWARRNGAVVIGDLHSGVFLDPKWKRFAPAVMRRLTQLGGAIVPNDELAAKARSFGTTTFVCHGFITPLDQVPGGAANLVAGNFVLVPLTYSRDEPVGAILSAAVLAPGITWVLTGKPPQEVRDRAGANVVFPGYVTREDYRALHLAARAIFALTTQDSTMQSAGYEAVASATPLVTVPFDVLTAYYGDAAQYVDNSPAQIAQAAQNILREHAKWSARMNALRDRIISEQGTTVTTIRAWIDGVSATPAPAMRSGDM